jgi:hypothetical protein
MIPFALFASFVCLGLLALDLSRRPGDPFVAVRVPMTGVWGMAWLVYGLNPVGFPQPSIETQVVLAVTCLGALLMCPMGYRESEPVVRGQGDAIAQRFLIAMLVVAGLLLAWDLYFITSSVAQHGWTAGLSQHRLDRGSKAGGYQLPGMEVLHAAVTAAGALGFAHWLRFRSIPGLAATLCGLLAALFSTGRWDVVAYAIWLFAVYGFHVRTGPSLVLKQAVVYAVLPVFFIAHGQLLGKLDLATTLANSTATERAAAASTGVPMVMSGGLRSQSQAAEVEAEAVATRECARWMAGLPDANEGFRRLSRVSRTLVLYMAGPMATLDRALCEGQVAQRTVLRYWPHKILRILGLRGPERLLVVDPFLDIGVPFNNYTVIYQFLSEVGPRLGLFAWVLLALVVSWFSARALRSGTASGIVAGSAILAMAIRTPWSNTFFDGTLVVWLAVALAPTLLAWAARRRGVVSVAAP